MDNPSFAPPPSAELMTKISKNPITISISNMRLRTYMGINDWEQKEKQDVVINIKINCHEEVLNSCVSDKIEDAVNYKNISKEVINYVEGSRFYLLEKMIAGILEIVLAKPMVTAAEVYAEKPGALRFSDSVGVSISGKND